MKPLRSSIRRQLLFWLVIPIIGLWLIDGAVTYVVATQLANEAYDRGLADTAKSVASRIVYRNNEISVDLPPAAQAILKDDEKDKIYFQVIGPHGKLLAGDAIIPSPAPVLDHAFHEPEFRDGVVENKPVRIATLVVSVPEAQKVSSKGQVVIIQMAETLIQRTELVDKILISVVLPELMLIAGAAFAVWLGVSRGLAPLKVVADAVAERSQWDLRPLSESDAPKEVSPLVHAINDLLGRLQNDIEAQRRFVANAAHQLRTPLAGLKTQIQLALRRTDVDDIHHAMKQIHTSADRCARLVNQLLVLARMEPGAADDRQYGFQDLVAASRSATEELVPDALRKGIDLGFEAPEQPAIIFGESLRLHELAFNLIENAVRYTQEGGKVTVRVTVSDCVSLIVEDNGPGIADHERERVFERFYRVLGTSVSGSGLGLAIVKEIAQSLDASVSLGVGPNGIGTGVHVTFMRPQALSQSTQEGIRQGVIQ